MKRFRRAADDLGDDGNRPAELSDSSINIFLLGYDKAPDAPVGESGRWQLAFLSEIEIGALYQRYRGWLRAEAIRRGLTQPWAERVYGGRPHERTDG